MPPFPACDATYTEPRMPPSAASRSSQAMLSAPLWTSGVGGLKGLMGTPLAAPSRAPKKRLPPGVMGTVATRELKASSGMLIAGKVILKRFRLAWSSAAAVESTCIKPLPRRPAKGPACCGVARAYGVVPPLEGRDVEFARWAAEEDCWDVCALEPELSAAIAPLAIE